MYTILVTKFLEFWLILRHVCSWDAKNIPMFLAFGIPFVHYVEYPPKNPHDFNTCKRVAINFVALNLLSKLNVSKFNYYQIF